MSSIYQTLVLLLLLLLLQIRGKITLAKPAAPQYSNATLQLARGIQMAAYMDVDVNPCDDFYNWACGHWSLSHPAAASKRKTSFVGLLENLYVSKCAAALQKPSNSNDAAAADVYLDNLLKAVFDSCHDTKAINTVGYAPIWDALELQGGWPFTIDDEWFENEYDWLKTVVLAKRKFNADVFIAFEVVKDLQHPEINRMQLGAPELALNESEAEFSENYVRQRENYQAHIAEKLQQLFPEMPNGWSEEVASQVIQVEEKLLKALPNATNAEAPLDRYVAELKVSYGNFVDLSRYLQLMFDRPINEKVYETPKGYFKNLVDVIRLTPKLTLANYTLWKVLDQFDLGGSKEFCVRKLMHFLPHELDYFYYRNYEEPGLFKELQTLFHNVKYNLYDELQTSPRFSWISPHTLQNLREKLRSMRVEVTQTQEQVGLFQGDIKPPNMQSNQYYSNIISLLEWQNEKRLFKLHQGAALLNTPQNHTQRNAQNMLPSYNSRTNTVQLPVVFLQSRFFWDPVYPVALKHGTFSFLLAQQIVRGLSDDESETDRHKVWDIPSELAFAKRASCYAQQTQYAAKEFRGRNVNDRERLKTALIDNGGLAIAFRAYEKALRVTGEREPGVLPRLPITHMQQFFLAYAQLFCADNAAELPEYDVLPEALRVNGAVANLAEFAKEFKCSGESKLKPKERCIIF
ncbi:endothelin-converting enzyme-like 1 [Anastrepha obliqua]|uniref:endothelin-converting enzyme-like 1 n=1 Tax=Anastrepha obliqua TaxID=95512 RepID=UPI00240A6668|nr:endothelin-converting enzyme-like 1 [Anastrepha obliqua]